MTRFSSMQKVYIMGQPLYKKKRLVRATFIKYLEDVTENHDCIINQGGINIKVNSSKLLKEK